MGKQTQALVQQLDAACRSVDDLALATEEAFFTRPDAAIITSFPGLSVMSGARVLAEVGDDRERFADARALKAYAGAAPVTRSSGRSHVVVARAVKNQRLASVDYMSAFAAHRSAEPREHYDRRRAGGERHTQPCETCSTSSWTVSTTACESARIAPQSGPSPCPSHPRPDQR
jgi:transposase